MTINPPKTQNGLSIPFSYGISTFGSVGSVAAMVVGKIG